MMQDKNLLMDEWMEQVTGGTANGSDQGYFPGDTIWYLDSNGMKQQATVIQRAGAGTIYMVEDYRGDKHMVNLDAIIQPPVLHGSGASGGW